jgi:hypothetical protein
MTSTKSPPVIQADIRRALDRMQVQYRENKGRFECIHLPSIDISYVDRPSTPQRHHHQQASSGSGDTPAAPTPRPSLVNKVSKLSFGIRGRDRSRDRDLSVDKEREASGGPSGVTLTRISSSSSSSFFNVTSHQPIAAPEPKLAPVVNGVAPTNLAGDVDRPPSRTASPVSVKVLPPIPRDFAASPMQMSPGMVDRDVFESMGNNMLSVRFEINIVKVRILSFVSLVREQR